MKEAASGLTFAAQDGMSLSELPYPQSACQVLLLGTGQDSLSQPSIVLDLPFEFLALVAHRQFRIRVESPVCSVIAVATMRSGRQP
jgi:hypothetical protein